ncbi:MAG: threonine efflux protein [Alteromonadaceae bacterium]|jgi:threonine efflux protein
MDLLQGLLLITSIHLLAAASPGPDFILVSQQTLTNGKKSGFMCSIGIALGLSIHIIYSALGLAAVIANSITALWAIKILGGCYLLYLGYKGITTKAELKMTLDVKKVPKHSSVKSIGIGFLCNALNPKAPIYFVALFTLVLSPNLPLSHLVLYGLWMMIIQLTWFSTVVLLLSRPSINERFKRLGHWIDRVLGGAMIIMGVKIITTRVN